MNKISGFLGSILDYIGTGLNKCRIKIAEIIFRLGGLLINSSERFKMKKWFSLHKKMDFSDCDIFLDIDSEIELSRRNACAKEPFTVDWLKRTACNGVLYDIGANVGCYSLIAAKIIDYNRQIVAFEPVYYNYYKLCKNIKINNCNDKIIPLCIALTEYDQLMDMYLSSEDTGSASHSIGFDNGKASSSIKIMCLSLDNVVNKFNLPFPNHLKIDVDGGELPLLRGARSTLKDMRLRSIMIEIDEKNPEEAMAIHKIIEESGFMEKSKYELITKGLFNTLFERTK